jgi:hypothetical protein
MSQLIDLGAAKEFMKETLERVNREDLIAIAADLEVKSNLFQRHLHANQISQLTNEGLEEILRNIFATRRRIKDVFASNSPEKIKTLIKNLLYGDGKIEDRFQIFVRSLDGLHDSLKTDVAGEILHFTNPDLYWLWSRWMWDPQKKTGAIALVTEEGFDLQGDTHGEVYMKVGKGVAFVHSIGEAADFQFISRTLFGTDVYLSCVYVVYAYTVLRMRMTKEFNKVMPGLPEFSRRLLGVLKMKEEAVI